MSKTTIQLDTETKTLLDKCKAPSESYDAAVRRLVEDEGLLFTEDEIRSMARAEAKDMIRQYS